MTYITSRFEQALLLLGAQYPREEASTSFVQARCAFLHIRWLGSGSGGCMVLAMSVEGLSLL